VSHGAYEDGRPVVEVRRAGYDSADGTWEDSRLFASFVGAPIRTAKESDFTPGDNGVRITSDVLVGQVDQTDE
jgi:hypothetical protein